MDFIHVTRIADARTKERGRRVARMHDINEHTWVAKPQLFGRSRCRCDVNIKIDLEEICRVTEWVQLAEDGFQVLAFANAILKVWVLQTAKMLVTS